MAALAGRRIDRAGEGDVRFPLSAVPSVRLKLERLFSEKPPRLLVCSAACGADLVALEVAEAIGIATHIVLPFSAEKFRETSVIDRPGNWGPVFDQALQHAEGSGGVTVLAGVGDPDRDYSAATRRIIDTASAADAGLDRVAVAVFEGDIRPDNDATGEFRALAISEGFRLEDVLIT